MRAAAPIPTAFKISALPATGSDVGGGVEPVPVSVVVTTVVPGLLHVSLVMFVSNLQRLPFAVSTQIWLAA